MLTVFVTLDDLICTVPTLEIYYYQQVSIIAMRSNFTLNSVMLLERYMYIWCMRSSNYYNDHTRN